MHSIHICCCVDLSTEQLLHKYSGNILLTKHVVENICRENCPQNFYKNKFFFYKNKKKLQKKKILFTKIKKNVVENICRENCPQNSTHSSPSNPYPEV